MDYSLVEFSNPVRVGDSLKASCNITKIESEEALKAFESFIVNFVSKMSLEWFKRHFTPEEITGKYSPKLFEKGLCVQGLLIHKSKFELDTFVEKSFFDHEETSENLIESVSDVHIEPVDTVVEPVIEAPTIHEECNESHESHEECVSESVDNEPHFTYAIDSYVDTLVNNKWIKAKIMMPNSDGTYKIMFGNGLTMDNVRDEDLRENKKKNYAQAIKQVKDELKESIEIKDYEKAYKLSKILSQLTR